MGKKTLYKKKSLNNIIFKRCGKMWLVFAFSKKRCAILHTFFQIFLLVISETMYLMIIFPKSATVI